MDITKSAQYAQMCRDYLEFSRAEVESLRPAVEQADFETIHIVAHKIKGTSGSYQLREVSQAAERLQEAADNRDAERLKTALDEVYNLIQDTLRTL
jgi:HPt (histidine-containing phosphotransfer) domain-containing protein